VLSPSARDAGKGPKSSEGGSPDAVHPEDLDAPDATPEAGFACADLTTFCRLDELGLDAELVMGLACAP